MSVSDKNFVISERCLELRSTLDSIYIAAHFCLILSNEAKVAQ